MERTTCGLTLNRESAALAVCLADDARLAAASVDDFQDRTVRRGLAAAKRLREKRTPEDLWTLRDVCRLLWGLDGDGKVLDLLFGRVRDETGAMRQKRAVRELSGRLGELTPAQVDAGLRAIPSKETT